MRRSIAKLFVPMVAALLLCSARPAQAGHDSAVEIQFWAFSRDARAMLVVIKDVARGLSTLALKAVGTYGQSVYELDLPPEVTPEQLPAYLAYPPFNAYGFMDGGVVGEAAPDGSGMIMSNKMGAQLVLFIARGETMKQMFGIPLGTSPDGSLVAEAKIKEIRWSANGKATAIIVHQSLAGDYGTDTDQLISFDPTPYKAKLGPMAPAGGAAPGKK